MAFALKRDNEFERWLRPFTGLLMLPGYRRELVERTRLFYDLYWQLLALGFTEQQIADHAVEWRWPSQIPGEVALDLAVFDLAKQWNLEVSERFDVYPALRHPRNR